MTRFAELGVPAEIVKVLVADGKSEAFPIQVDTLPATLDGGDVLGRGRTGSGKTLAFSIPLVAGLAELDVDRVPGAPTGLILAPTRELATQIATAVEPLAKAVGLTVTTIFGGVKQARQEQALGRGVDIVVACPGRLEDLMQQRIVRLDNVEITVIDEADHMADLGFLPGVTRILAATPSDGQRMLFSATLDRGVDKLAKRFLHNPTMHSVDEATSPVEAMTHHVFEIEHADKNAMVAELASGAGRRILFTRTKHQARKLAKKLTADGIPAVDLHGNLSQPQRDRNLKAFGEGGVRVLVATDVAARGVHVDDIELVVHVDPPAEHKAYLHRSGRTARAGNAGDVVTLCLPDQRRDVAGLLGKAAIKVKPVRVRPASSEVDSLVGERAERVEPTAEPVRPAGRPRQGAAGGRGRPGSSGSRRRGSGQRDARGQQSSRGSDQRGSGHESSGRNGSGARGSGQRSSGQGRGGQSRGQQGSNMQGRGQQRGGRVTNQAARTA
ncbi:DEAD/DEAH box helicase [Gordonia otitidis]|uniref:ATP-dependent RNA helicase n=1 Tax=Gordonia otitidis (strain DSM 44809 / CCUG 52243 / JCM 12355 / NBRC 100426 / IFM 10032) TaxID=1108044 RepID=H5TFJ7_GORO1|nr:DEAD/DEAH box helicase [Gordonia otitidis]GAB32255.1 putative ATP-dependent RNA helicase [Gordonia otitidis NBRC 100426]